MFISALIYNSQDMEATWVSINRWMEKDDVVNIYTMEYYAIIKKNEILPFAGTWMDLEGIMLSEISQRKTHTIWFHLYVESKKYNKLVNKTKKKQTRRCKEQTSGY